MKGYTAVANAFRDADVDTMFGVMGDGNMFYLGAFKDSGGRYIGAVDEGGALSMADGFARLQGLGVASVTHGPGAANTINALIEAVRANSPLVLITSTTPGRRGQNQQISLEELLTPTGAEYHRVLAVDHVVDDVSMVLARVASSRRPIVLDIPIDLQMLDVDYQPSRLKRHARVAAPPVDDDLDVALGIIASARRPLILAGRGAVLAEAGPALVRLADAIGAPLATTASAKGLFRGHPYNLGLMGDCGVPWAVGEMAQADCVVAFGAGLNVHTTADKGMLDGRTVVHVDTDASAIGRHAAVDAAVVGDARATAEMMVRQIEEAGVKATRFREDRLGAGVLDRDHSLDYQDQSGSAFMDARTALISLERLLPEDRVVVTDGGRFIVPTWRYLHASHARDFIHTMAWQSIGLANATAIGAAAASPGRLTVCIAGDGGAMMGLIEFSTAVRHDLPYALIVINDGAYGVEYTKFQDYGFDPKYSLYDWPELADVARSLGGAGHTVRTHTDLETAVAGLSNLTRPTLIDIKVDPAVNSMA
jgi:acetolactate synthase-1/2/3 large subunit